MHNRHFIVLSPYCRRTSHICGLLPLGPWNSIFKWFLRLNYVFFFILTPLKVYFTVRKRDCPSNCIVLRILCKHLQEMYTLNSFLGSKVLKIFIPREILMFPLFILRKKDGKRKRMNIKSWGLNKNIIMGQYLYYFLISGFHPL